MTVYAHAAKRAKSTESNVLTTVLSELEGIPADYAGAFATEITALRDSMPQKIADAQAAEEALAQQRAAEEAARQAEAARRAEEAAQAAQNWKPPFNSGTGGQDDGAGSGNSLREDYGDPEDLYEDGDYEDLDEAWDEWEEGW